MRVLSTFFIPRGGHLPTQRCGCHLAPSASCLPPHRLCRWAVAMVVSADVVLSGPGSGAMVSSTSRTSVPPLAPFWVSRVESCWVGQLFPGAGTQVMASTHLTPWVGRSCISYPSASHFPRPWVAQSTHHSSLTALPLCSCPLSFLWPQAPRGLCLCPSLPAVLIPLATSFLGPIQHFLQTQS